MKYLTLFACIALLIATTAEADVKMTPALRPFSFHRDGVLGTSIDLTFVSASASDAGRAEQAAYDEIERLRKLLSSWDGSSEVSRLFTSGFLAKPSTELLSVLQQYNWWNKQSNQAYSARVGELTSLWQAATLSGKTPDSLALARVVSEITRPAWNVDPVSQTVTALTSHRIDLNSLGKGFIIDRAILAVRSKFPNLRGGMINIGGDIHVWGAAPNGAAWRIAVANPQDHADNAVPLTRLVIRDRAVSSSGDYQRGFDIAGKHYSHIIDPRTGYPVDAIIGTTVIASDNATANALATTLSVLPPSEGLKLAQSIAGVEAMVVTANGETIRTPGFANFEEPLAVKRAQAAAIFTATLAIDVTPTEKNRHPPYVAVWISDTAGTPIRTLLFWGEKPKYQHEMTKWWSANQAKTDVIDAVTRATRPQGKYSVDWDGLDLKGAPLPKGPYIFWLEVAFEDGAHSAKSVTVTCGPAHGAGSIPSASAFTGADITCDPVKN